MKYENRRLESNPYPYSARFQQSKLIIGLALRWMKQNSKPSALNITIETVKSKHKKLNSFAEPLIVRTRRFRFWLCRPSLAIRNTRKIRMIRNRAKKATFSVALPTIMNCSIRSQINQETNMYKVDFWFDFEQPVPSPELAWFINVNSTVSVK